MEIEGSTVLVSKRPLLQWRCSLRSKNCLKPSLSRVLTKYISPPPSGIPCPWRRRIADSGDPRLQYDKRTCDPSLPSGVRAVKIVSDLRAIRDVALTYNMDLHKWPRSRGWGRVPRDFKSHFPPGVTFDLGSWDVKYAYSNYSNRSDRWKERRGYSVILRARIRDRQLSNAVLGVAPDFFDIVQINRTRGIFTVILE